MNVYSNTVILKIMAIVYEYIIIYFTLMIHVHESMSSEINRNMCLETVARLMDFQYKCSFDLSTAQTILQDDTTCPYKCNIWIKNLHDSRNSLQEIDLTIGNEKKIFNPCLSLYRYYDVNILINCSLGNAMKYITWDDVYACSINDAHCVHINNYCVCHCLPGYILANKKCLKKMVNIGGICEFDLQCNGTEFANVCKRDICSCNPGYIQINRTCYMYKEQCSLPFTVCFQGKCQCINGYSALDRESCLRDTVPFGGFCSLHEQCTGSDYSGVCENGICTCSKGFTFTDLACEKDHPNSLGRSDRQQHDVNIGVTLGTLFGGFILGVIVTAVVTTLMYKRLKFRNTKREDLRVMFTGNRAYGCALIPNRNDKKQDVAKLSPYSFAKETQGYDLSSNQEDERTEDVYNVLREQTEHEDDTYDHACTVPNHSTDLSDYSNIQDAATFRPSLSKDGDGYSTLRH